MEEIIKLHNRLQEGTSTENKEEKMDIEENEKEEKNTQPWITTPPTKKRENKSKNSQPADKPGTSKKPPTSTPTSSHQPPKHLVISNKSKSQTLVQPQSQTLEQPQLDTRPNKNNNSNKQRKPPPIMLYGNEQINNKHIREKNKKKFLRQKN
ncbi:hypothetical protein K0M31_016063 [Melipona bicolor]|uniref:Uncharacterized protein n=1 Tax=Melipona bicolor TaxID=60889 RepID=A0AA40G6H1_9HYME|nr:hypothetical protein K0M31_016063 [Melipona bicolor]